MLYSNKIQETDKQTKKQSNKQNTFNDESWCILYLLVMEERGYEGGS